MKRIFLLFATMLLMVFSIEAQELRAIDPCTSSFVGIDGQIISTLTYQNQGIILIGFYIETTEQSMWDYLSMTTTIQDFYNQYGPNGENKVRVFFTFYTDGDYSDCDCCYYGDCPTSVGDWSLLVPPNSDIFFYDPNIDYTLNCEAEETVVRNINYTNATAHMPDRKIYILSAGPTLLELQNLIALHDSLDGENNANLMFTNTQDLDHCSGQTRDLGRVVLSNNGTNALTQATIGIGWNGVLQDSFTWEGNIAPYHLVNLDSIPNLVHMDADSGNIEVYVLSVNNGQTDPEPANDTLRVFSKVAVDVSSDSLVLEWKTSNFTEYSYMDMVTEDGEYLFSVGDSSLRIFPQQSPANDTFQNHTVYRFPISISEHGEKCLKLRGYTYGGSKLGAWVRLYAINGDVEIEIADMSNILGSDHYDQRSLYTTFPAPVPPIVDYTAISIRPNPSNTEVWVSDIKPKTGTTRWQVSNSMGQVIATKTTSGQLGNTEAHFDTALWPSGIYFITLQHEQMVATEILRVQH